MRTKRTERAEQTGRMPLPVKCVAIFLTLAVLAGTALYCWLSYEPNSYTVCSDDGYYSETTYYRTEDAFERAQEKEKRSGAVQVRSVGTDGTAAQKEAEGEFVSAATKTVWVSETVHESGAVLDSHLMTKAEIEEAEEEETLGIKPRSIISTLGTAEETKQKLSITYRVCREASDYEPSDLEYVYSLVATAKWENGIVWFWETDKAAEEKYLDYAAFTWGGEGALYKTALGNYGYYYNNEETDIVSCKDEKDVGIIWMFNEKSGYLGSEMEFGLFEVCLNRKGEFQNKEAQAKFIYVHTYDTFDMDIDFTFGGENAGDDDNDKISLAAGISIGTTKSSWQIELAIDGLMY